MSVTVQIILGSAVLGLCSMIHIAMLVGAVPLFGALGARLAHVRRILRLGILLTGAVALVVLAHTIQVWIWAFSFLIGGEFQTVGDALYFSLSTYTTVGYGDVILGPDTRIFAAMESVAGLLSFGLSTAFLVSFLERLFPRARR